MLTDLPMPLNNFYPRPPGGGRRSNTPTSARRLRFLSTPSGWRATAAHRIRRRHDLISIHALRVEGDRAGHSCIGFAHYFYPRPPGGGRLKAHKIVNDEFVFLSTPSGWRATHRRTRRGLSRRFLSTPSGWRATGWGWFDSDIELIFLSTPSGWRATAQTFHRGSFAKISIHALRVEGDHRFLFLLTPKTRFLSTPSGWRATVPQQSASRKSEISIHALRVEGDNSTD